MWDGADAKPGQPSGEAVGAAATGKELASRTLGEDPVGANTWNPDAVERGRLVWAVSDPRLGCPVRPVHSDLTLSANRRILSRVCAPERPAWGRKRLHGSYLQRLA